MDKVVEELRRVMIFRENTILKDVKAGLAITRTATQQQPPSSILTAAEEQKTKESLDTHSPMIIDIESDSKSLAPQPSLLSTNILSATAIPSPPPELPQILDPRILGVCLSSRRNMCIHPEVSNFDNRNKVDALCRNLTASFIREQHAAGVNIPICNFFEGFERYGKDQSSLYGIYSLADLKQLGLANEWCPYFYTRWAINHANVVVYNYQYMLDPKISGLVSRELNKDSIVVFDEVIQRSTQSLYPSHSVRLNMS